MGLILLTAVLTLMLGFIFLFFMYTSTVSSKAKIKIIIYADDPDETEKAVINTYHHTVRYLKHAQIYIHGRDEDYVSSLLRAYTFLKRDDTFEKPTNEC